MRILVEVVDIIRTGMVSVPGESFYEKLEADKYFHAKKRIFSVHSEHNGNVLFRFDNIPIGQMIKEHAAIYHDTIRQWSVLKELNHNFDFYAELYPMTLRELNQFTIPGSKKIITSDCYLIVIKTIKN